MVDLKHSSKRQRFMKQFLVEKKLILFEGDSVAVVTDECDKLVPEPQAVQTIVAIGIVL